MTKNRTESFISEFTKWAEKDKRILGAILVGSWARGTAQNDSDIDFVVITNKPDEFLNSSDWLAYFGKPSKIETENFGLVQSKRVFYENGLEVEFGITSPEWLKSDPIDPGTQRVMLDGYKVLDDKAGLISKFISRAVKM